MSISTSFDRSPIVCYLDESATDAQDTDHAVLAGIVLNRRDVPEFDRRWSEVLCEYGVTGGLHMKELGPNRRLAHIAGNQRSDLLAAAVAVINDCRIFTLGASLHNREYERLVDEKLRKKMVSVYAAAFMMCVVINSTTARTQNYLGTVDFVLDRGNRYRRHVEEQHRVMLESEELSSFQVGALNFYDDEDIRALQAADVIAWSTRRRKAGLALKGPLEPLEALFDDSFNDSPLSAEALRQLAAAFARAEE